MRDINKTDYVFKHRVLWFDIGWLCEKIANSSSLMGVTDLKRESLRRRFPKENPICCCFICEYARRIKRMMDRYKCFSSYSECTYCPLIARGQFKNGCLNGYFSLFMHLVEYKYDYKKAAEVAYKIASMPAIN